MWYNLALAAGCHIDMNNAHTHTHPAKWEIWSNGKSMPNEHVCALCKSKKNEEHNCKTENVAVEILRGCAKKFALEWKVFFIKFAIFQSKLPAYSYKLRNIFAVNFAFIWYMQHSFSRWFACSLSLLCPFLILLCFIRYLLFRWCLCLFHSLFVIHLFTWQSEHNWNIIRKRNKTKRNRTKQK